MFSSVTNSWGSKHFQVIGLSIPEIVPDVLDVWPLTNENYFIAEEQIKPVTLSREEDRKGQINPRNILRNKGNNDVRYFFYKTRGNITKLV